jgi:protein SCO1/2
VTNEEAWLEAVEKTGWAPFPEAASVAPAPVPLLKDGEPLPDATLVDQDGGAFRLSTLRGAPLLITFIYTRCPLPDFCPRMDRHFQALQRAIKLGAVPAGTRLLSVSFDPEYDTPTVLKAHAKLVGADPRIWTFATAPKPQIETFAGRLGLSVVREADTQVLTHNLRTAIVDQEGRLVTVLGGNEWTPEQAVAVLRQLRR